MTKILKTVRSGDVFALEQRGNRLQYGGSSAVDDHDREAVEMLVTSEPACDLPGQR